ncbi:MAG: flagellar export chaperone FlgN [Eubacteriales bacterium]
MAKQDWLDYFDLLGKLAEVLEKLASVQGEKTLCVNKGNLPRIEEIMKEEQVCAMTLRGYEQKRLKYLEKLNVPPGKITELVQHMPEDVIVQGKKMVKKLQTAYENYNEKANISRQTLQAHLVQLEDVTGVESGYAPPGAVASRSLEKEGVFSGAEKSAPATTSVRAKAMAEGLGNVGNESLSGTAPAPGNVQLNLRQFQNKPSGDNKKVVPVSQERLRAVQKENDEAESNVMLGGDATSALRQLAQKEEKARMSILQKKTLKHNADNEI